MSAHRTTRTGEPAHPAGAARLLDRAVFAGLLLVLVALPLPFGGHRPWAENLFELAVFALLALASLNQALRQPGGKPHLGRGLLAIMLLWTLWLGWILAQAQPWPQEWIAQVSPHRWQLAHDAARDAGTTLPAHFALSLDAAQTRSHAQLSAAYVALFLLFALSLHGRKRMRWLLWALLLSGLAQALYGSAMVLSGMEYGAWGPKQDYRGFATGSFVNRNHFAGYLEICLAVAVGLIVSSPRAESSGGGWRGLLRRLLDQSQDTRLFARVCIALFFVALILSQSRMGNVAAVAGLCVAALAQLATGRWRKRGLGILLLVGSVLLIDIWLFGRWFGLEQLAERYAQVESAADNRLSILQDLRSMIPVYGLGGSGLGTFMLAYPQFRAPDRLGLLDHAHNDYAQFLIEAGLPGVILLGLLVIATALRALLILRRRRDPMAQGMAVALLGALAALAVHSGADFNLQIPANAATLVVLMAATWATGTQKTRGKRRVRRRTQAPVPDEAPVPSPTGAA